jgi:hypothetical protein
VRTTTIARNYAEALFDLGERSGNTGRYAELIDIVLHWHQIGFVMQGSAIAGDGSFSAEQFLEVENLLDEPAITPWPMYSKNLDS